MRFISESLKIGLLAVCGMQKEKRANKALVFSYYEYIWLDLDMLPYKEMDYFMVTKPKTTCDISSSRVYYFTSSENDGFWQKVWVAIMFYLYFPMLLWRYQFFLIVAPPYFHFLAAPILKLFRKNVCIICWDPYSEIVFEPLWQCSRARRMLRYLLYPLYIGSEYISIKCADRVYAISRYLVNKYKPWNREVYHSPNARQPNFADAIPLRRVVKEPYLYYVGSIMKWRGIDLMLGAFDIVKKKYKQPLKLVVVGGSREDYKDYPEVLPYFDRKDIIFLPRTENKLAMSYMKGAYLGLMPNRNAAMSHMISSLKIFEYIAAEIPHVCTDSGEHAHFVKQLKTGIVVPDTPDGIADGILQLLNNKKFYVRCKENCRKAKKTVNRDKSRKAVVEYVQKQVACAKA